MSRAPNRVAAVAAVGAGGALLCAACCVAPFAVSAAALASFGGLLAWFAGGYHWMSVAALALVAGAWIWVMIETWLTKKRPARMTWIVLGFATIAVALALAWPLFEGQLAHLLSRK